MRALLSREALVVARKPAVVTMAVLYSGLLALLLSAFDGHRVPMLPGATIYAQLYLLQCAMLVVVMPWAAVRGMATERADELVRLSATLALKPSQLVLARLLAASIGPAVVVAGALPVALVAQQISAVPAVGALADQFTLLTFALPAAVLTVWWLQCSRDRLSGWLRASASAILLIATVHTFFPGAATAAIVSGAGALAAGFVLVARADVWWRHLQGETA